MPRSPFAPVLAFMLFVGKARGLRLPTPKARAIRRMDAELARVLREHSLIRNSVEY